MRFSPSNLGWYPESIEYPNLPDDCITVSDDLWKSLLGKQLSVGADGMPQEFVPPPYVAPIPTVVTMRQARLALLQAGKLAAVNQALATLTGVQGEAARIEWEFAATVDRGSELVTMLAAALSLSDDDLEALFTTAASL